MSDRAILLVEDDPNDEELILLALRHGNIANPAVVAHDGVEALDYLFGRRQFAGRDTSDLPALVLLDLALPELDGLEVLSQIRAHPDICRVPVVVLTSSKQDEDRVTSHRLGANGYVRKPLVISDFAHAVQKLGAQWLLFKERA